VAESNKCTLSSLLSFPIFQQSRIVGFSWHNCGADADPFRFNILTISPDPVRLPGKIISQQL